MPQSHRHQTFLWYWTLECDVRFHLMCRSVRATHIQSLCCDSLLKHLQGNRPGLLSLIWRMSPAGIVRCLRTFGGRTFILPSYLCDLDFRVSGRYCTVRLTRGRTTQITLFNVSSDCFVLPVANYPLWLVLRPSATDVVQITSLLF